MRSTLNAVIETIVAFLVIAFAFGLWLAGVAWVTLLPSIGVLWLIGWLS